MDSLILNELKNGSYFNYNTVAAIILKIDVDILLSEKLIFNHKTLDSILINTGIKLSTRCNAQGKGYRIDQVFAKNRN